MAPLLDWGKLLKVDPDALPSQEEEAENLVDSLSKVDSRSLKDESTEHLVQLFRITQSLMKMKAQEVELALEEVEKAGGEQAKIESQLKNKVMRLENELEMAQQSTGGRDTRFLRDEIRQLEKQLEQKDRELSEMEKEIDKEKKVNEQLALRNEEADNESSKLRRENEQLRQDVIDYQRQIDSQRETLMSRRGGDADYRSQLSKKNLELVQYLDDIQNLTEANEKLEVQNREMTKNLEESVQEMEKMTDEYSKMKLVVQQTDSVMDQLRKEKEQYRLQIIELTEQIKAKNEDDDPVMAAVNTKVEEWKRILAAKDDELIEYQQILHDLREKLKNAQLDADKGNVMALQQGVQDRDNQIKLLSEQVKQYTSEMEKNALVIEDLKIQLQRGEGMSSLTQQNRLGELQAMLQLLEQRCKEADRVAELAEGDAREKDKELVDTLKRMREYEMGVYGLEEAVAEIKELKSHIKTRDREIENSTKEINQLELKINDLLDENEDLRERLGLDPKTVIDLTEFKNNKTLKQQQYRAENQILLKEIERLEEERLELKQHIRKLAQDKGKRAASLGLTADDLQLVDNSVVEKTRKRTLDIIHPTHIETPKDKGVSQLNKKSTGRREGALCTAELDKDATEKDTPLFILSGRVSEIIDQCVRKPEKHDSLTSAQFEYLHVARAISRDSCKGLQRLSIEGMFTSSTMPSSSPYSTYHSELLKSHTSNPKSAASSMQIREASFTSNEMQAEKSRTVEHSQELTMSSKFQRNTNQVISEALSVSKESAVFSQVVLGKPVSSTGSNVDKSKAEKIPFKMKKSRIKSGEEKNLVNSYTSFKNQTSKEDLFLTHGVSESHAMFASGHVGMGKLNADEDSLSSISMLPHKTQMGAKRNKRACPGTLQGRVLGSRSEVVSHTEGGGAHEEKQSCVVSLEYHLEQLRLGLIDFNSEVTLS